MHSLAGKGEGKRPVLRIRHRWQYNIKVDLTEIGVEIVDWFSLALDRGKSQDCCECGDEPSGSTKRGKFPD
jgi:hypothetical protein